MANKRKLKKTINNICGELIAECVAASLYNGEKTADDAASVIKSIISVHDNYTRRISHPEPGMPAKIYFKDLIDKFNLEVSELIDQICNLQ